MTTKLFEINRLVEVGFWRLIAKNETMKQYETMCDTDTDFTSLLKTANVSQFYVRLTLISFA